MQDQKNYDLKIRNRIRMFRKQKGLSQEKLAELVDSSREHINRMESGKDNISLSYFIKLAEVFEISLDELAGFRQE